MTHYEVVGTVSLGPTLGTLPQLGEDVRDGISARIQGSAVTVDFTSTSPRGSQFMPFSMTVRVTCFDDDISSRRSAFAILIRVTKDALDMIKVTQPTTGMPGVLPKLDSVEFYENGLVTPLGFDWSRGYRDVAMILWSTEVQPHAEDFRRAIQGELNPDWDLDLLLGQARHYAQNNWDSNPALSLFLSTLALEAKMKRVLHRKCPESMRALLLEEVPEDKQIQGDVRSLFSSKAKKYLGISLKRENPELWDNLVTLFPLRNNFAHRAELVDRDQAQIAAVCARRVMLWADQGELQNYPH
ncbi:hypothetical protein [Pseudoclavibacter sp. RFBA6]|uniref:hypothetical protein n=1 Tax=Pseudoclavibacter sp. RFBA6 TaxID=2080573 RepID=UPI0011B09BD2|nr:hypothetical protein [Pseudoclavibacter sp. RFBA6]